MDRFHIAGSNIVEIYLSVKRNYMTALLPSCPLALAFIFFFNVLDIGPENLDNFFHISPIFH